MHKELSLAMKDLRYVGVTCKDCHTEVVLDMESKYRPEDGGHGFAPDGCPTCGTAFDSAIKPALDRFRAVYASLAKLEAAVHFRVAGPD
jgi:endogenous inhibitor of DNA gyrase (YacG/DUF329 family)